MWVPFKTCITLPLTYPPKFPLKLHKNRKKTSKLTNTQWSSETFFSLFPPELKNQHNEKGNVASFKSIRERFDWLIRGPVFAGWGLVRGIFYLIGAGFGCCDLRFTAHLVTLCSMLPFLSLNGEGHSKIVKLGVENSAWLPAVPWVFRNWLLCTVFSLKHWKVSPSASSLNDVFSEGLGPVKTLQWKGMLLYFHNIYLDFQEPGLLSIFFSFFDDGYISVSRVSFKTFETASVYVWDAAKETVVNVKWKHFHPELHWDAKKHQQSRKGQRWRSKLK